MITCIHGLQNLILSAIFHLYIGYRKRNSTPIINRKEYRWKIGEKSAKSAIYRRNIGLEPINREWSWRVKQPEEDFKKWPKISPVFAGKGCVFQPGSKIVYLGFVKLKSNGTTAKRPLKQIQKTQGAKEKQFFWFSLGVLHGFSRKSNEDEFSRKSNGGWIFLGIKRGLQKNK